MPVTKIDKKRDGLQGYRVRVNFTDPATGEYRRVERIVYGKAEAAEMERRLTAEAKAAPSADARLTVSEFAQQYLKYKSTEVRATTLALMERHLRTHILPTLGPLRLAAVTPRIIADWLASLHDSGCARSSIQSYHVLAKAMFARAVELGLIPSNPFPRRVPRAPLPDAPPQELHYYTPEQFAAFYRAVSGPAVTLRDWDYATYFAVAFYTGMRRGEIMALRWPDIDFEARLIRVRRSYAAAGSAATRVETPPKTRSSIRDLSIPAPLLSALLQQLARQQAVPGFSPGCLVCGGPEHLTASSIASVLRKAAAAAGLPRIRVHDFRHSHASLLVNNGINIQEVARRLGHSNVEVTWAIYSHLYPREEERATSVLDAVPLPGISDL